MSRILVIRFGALGDLCLLCWSLTRTAEANGNPRPHVTLATKAAFADLLSRVPGIDEVVPLAGPRLHDLWDMARRLRGGSFDCVIDAHNNLRSHLLLAALGCRPDHRLAKDTAARLAFLAWRRQSPRLDRTMRERFDEVMPYSLLAGGANGSLPTEVSPLTGQPMLPPLAIFGIDSPASQPVLGLAPGAQWDTKRWPQNNYCQLLREFRDLTAAPVRLFLGPREADWFPDSPLDRLTRELPGVRIWQDDDLVSVASGLAGCTTLVTNDSGLLHLAESVGTPVVALFGPTVREFGYFPTLPASHVLETPLACRPCSRNGKKPCYRGDLACLTEITPQAVLQLLFALPAWQLAASGGKEGSA